MSRTASPRTTTHRILGPTAVALVVSAAAIAGLLSYQPASSTAPPTSQVSRADQGAATADDGVLPHGVTVFDDSYPGVVNLDPDLLHALREAATDATEDGITFYVNSGWRSPKYQNQLLREAVSEYGSEAAAERWVATADTSAHVSGHAVDIGPVDATAWLSKHGAEYGLCQIYKNESWHYQLHAAAIARGCPVMYADPTQDPRMLGHSDSTR